MASILVSTLIEEAFLDLNIYQPGASIKTNDQNLVLSKLNQILDNWNADSAAVWCDVLSEFTITPNLNPHTIGPSGATWTLAVRPEDVFGCALNLNTSTPNIYLPISVIDRGQYEALAVPGIATSIPMAVYYEKDWPKGKLFFYPVPTTAYKVRISTRTLLAQVVITDSIDFPPGYQAALTLTLEEDIAPSFGRECPASISVKAQQARARAFTNNVVVPVLDLRDGQSMQHGKRSNFSYRSRSFIA